MTKKVNRKSANSATSEVETGQFPDPVVAETAELGRKRPLWLYDARFQAIIIALIAMIFYANTYKNEYALDDTVVVVRNEFVHQGFAGIPDILTKDAYFSYFDQLKSTNQLSGGRYRPLSIVTFAIEQQFFGATGRGQVDSILSFGLNYGMNAPYEKKFLHEMRIRHVLNVGWYMLAVVVLLFFLRQVVFKGNPLAAFLAALLFAIHPVHTEVVANVKSRDEIMSLLFICLTFIFASRYREQQEKKWLLAAGLLSYALAFLSKEYAITLVLLLPLSFYLFGKESILKSTIAALPYVAVAIVYLCVRLQVIGPRSELADNDIQINPYAFASASEKMATEISTSLNYLKLLIWPHPLSSDYSYAQIPYRDFSDAIVWVSLAVHVLLLAGLVYFFRKRHVLCFAIGFYLFNLLMVNNFLFDIGATMGERLIFHSSVGFVIAVAWLMNRGMERINPITARAVTAVTVTGTIIALSGFKTITRNADWKNDETLFFRDIEVSPNSFLINMNVATIMANRSDLIKDEQVRVAQLRKAVELYSMALAIQDNYVLAYMNRSIAYLKLGKADSMMNDLNRVKTLYPVYPTLPEMYYHAGMLYYDSKQYANAAAALQQSLQLNPRDAEVQKALNDVNMAMQTQK